MPARYLNSQFMNLVMRRRRYPCLYTLLPTLYVLPLRPTLYTISDGDHASNLSPLASNL